MPVTRLMSGLADLTGEKCGTLSVRAMVSRRAPIEPRYEVICEKCSTVQTAMHSRLRNGTASCQYSGCGKTQQPRGRDLLTEHRKQIAQREAERAAEEREAAELRMRADVESLDWEKQEAERQAADERRAAQREEADRATQRERGERRLAYERQWVLTDPDPKIVVTPALVTAKMRKSEANAHNAAEVEKFIKNTPEYLEFKTPENAEVLLSYFDRNGLSIFDAEMLRAAFIRLRELGILEKKIYSRTAQPAKDVNLSIASESPAPATIPTWGRDQRTGEMRNFSPWDIERMSAEEYRKTFAIAPTVSELFTRMNRTR